MGSWHFVVLIRIMPKFESLVTPIVRHFRFCVIRGTIKSLDCRKESCRLTFKSNAVRPIWCSTDETVRVIVVLTINRSFIRQLLKAGKLEKHLLEDKNEKFIITSAHNPLKGLEGDVLLIAGSDKARYYLWSLWAFASDRVSPLYWWADVPQRTKMSIINGEKSTHWPLSVNSFMAPHKIVIVVEMNQVI